MRERESIYLCALARSKASEEHELTSLAEGNDYPFITGTSVRGPSKEKKQNIRGKI